MSFQPVVRQNWLELTFLHWRYDPAIIRSTLPADLTLDTFDGSAWIGLVPFILAGVSPPSLPAAPWLSTFPETNVRTYVTGPDGKPGVWFYTLEADRLLAVLAARAWYKLPYRWAAMTVKATAAQVTYKSRRSAVFGQGSTHLIVQPGAPMPTEALDHFLTARFRLYTAHRGKLVYADVEHTPWPLQHATVTTLDEDLIVNSGLPAPKGEPLIHFSKQLVVLAGRPLRY